MDVVEKAREEGRMLGRQEASRDREDVAHDRLRGEFETNTAKVDQVPMYRGGNGPLPGRAAGMAIGGGESSGVNRIQAREALRQRAYELRRKAQQLDALASAIPDNFPGDAEAALWDLALSVRTY